MQVAQLWRNRTTSCHINTRTINVSQQHKPIHVRAYLIILSANDENTPKIDDTKRKRGSIDALRNGQAVSTRLYR